MTQQLKNLGLTVLAVLTVSPVLAQATDEVVIELGDQTVTQSEFDERFNLTLRSLAQRQGVPLNEQTRALFDQLRPNYLEQLATEQALLQEADARGLSVSAEEIDAQLDQLRENYDTDEAYTRFLNEVGFDDEATFSDFIRENLLVQKVVTQLGSNTQVTDEEVQTFYDQNQEQIGAPLGEVRDQIRQQLRGDALNARIAEVRAGADVRVFPENLGLVSGMSGGAGMSGGSGMSGGAQ